MSAFYLLLGTVLLMFVADLSEIRHFLSALEVYFMAVLHDMAVLYNFLEGEALSFELPTLSPTLFGLFFFIVPYLFIWTLNLGYIYYVRGITRGNVLHFRDLFEGFNFFRKIIFIRCFLFVTTYLGSFLLVLPGLWAMCAFSQAQLLLLDHPDRGAIWCLKESKRLMMGHKWEYFVLRLSFLGWYLLPSLFAFLDIPLLPYLAMLWYLIYSTFAFVGYYNKLTGQGPPEEPEWKRPGMF